MKNIKHQTVAACTERRCSSHHWHQAKGPHHSSSDVLTLAADKSWILYKLCFLMHLISPTSDLLTWPSWINSLQHQRWQNNNTIKCRDRSAKRVLFSVSSEIRQLDDWVTARDRHTHAAATGNARSPIVERFILGTTSAVHRWRPQVLSGNNVRCSPEIRWQWWSHSMLTTEHQHCQGDIWL